MPIQTTLLLCVSIFSMTAQATMSEKAVKEILVKSFKNEKLADSDLKKWNPISVDFNADKKLDEVIWLKNKAGNDHFVLLLAEKESYKVILLVEYDSTQKFCGNISIKKPNEKGISGRTYFVTDDDRPAALKKKAEAIKAYVPALAIEISTDLKSSPNDEWTDEFYCTNGLVFHREKVLNYLVCD